MTVQFITVGNCKIAYIEKNKDASKTIFFISGNSVSKSCWRKQNMTAMNYLDIE